MINVAVQPGWSGGTRYTKQFEDTLRAGGFNVTDSQHADVLFAHSVACYSLPVKSPVNLYILIDPPYWPGESIYSRLLKIPGFNKGLGRPPQDLKSRAAEGYWHARYALQRPQYAAAALKNFGKLDFLAGLKEKQVIVVRNQQDYFCSPDIQVALASYPNVRYAVLPGGHDDYYTNPKPYIDLLYKAI